MADNTIDTTSELMPEEIRVLKLWQKGMSMTDAYKNGMLSKFDQEHISEVALRKRVSRFFSTYRMREAMANTPGERGKKARADFERWKITLADEATTQASPYRRIPTYRYIEQNEYDEKETGIKAIDDDEKERKRKTRQEWLDSLKIFGDLPKASTVFDTGRFLFFTAISEMIKRQIEIEKRGISVLEKDGSGSALTSNIIAAIKVGASLTVPFAPAPTAEERRGMAAIAAFFNQVKDDIKENPDDYTAPIPPTVEVAKESDGNN